jgi:WD40 repeat protein
LAAINAAGKLTDWNPDSNGNVYTLAAGSDVVYVGGMFSSVGGQARSKLAAVATDGTVTSWNPSVYAYGWVETLALSGNTIFVGGDFSSIAGQARKNLAAVDSGGALLPWAPEVTVGPQTMVVMGGVLYVAGGNLAAISADGSVRPWNPASNDYVYALATDGTTLYAGGYFTSMEGQTRNHLAAFDSSGNLLPWNPDLGSDTNEGVMGLAVLADKVYAAGEFTSVAGQPRSGLAAIGSDGVLAPWDPAPDSAPRCVGANQTTLVVGGAFASIASKAAGGVARYQP